jgi:hypothetical protein
LVGGAFPRGVVAAFPYPLHTVPAGDGAAFPPNASTEWDREVIPFHRGLPRARDHAQAHPASSPIDERPGGEDKRTAKAPSPSEGALEAFHHEMAVALSLHVPAFVRAENLAEPLKAAGWRTSFQAVVDA